MASHPLDNPVWGALTGRHAPLAIGMSRVKRYRADVGLFAGAESPPAALEELPDILSPGDVVGIVTREPVAVPAGLEVVETMRAPQMLVERPLAARDVAIEPLTDADVPAMLELTALTRPGPFLPRTIEMGAYFGIFDGRRLVAMAGERMQPPGYTEISAVCTHPDYVRRGYAAALMARVARGIMAQGETPFLHVRSDNNGAISAYQAMGLVTRCEMVFTILRRPGAPAA